jgi:hypothetical protein
MATHAIRPIPGGFMRTIILALLLLLAVAASAHALDTYADDAPVPAATTPGDTTGTESPEDQPGDQTPDQVREEGESPPDTDDQDTADKDAANEEQPDEGAADQGDPASPGYTSVISDDLRLEPLGSITLRDGTVYEIMDFVKLGKYYIYISGKLNGRSSTVVSLTRLSDLQDWAAINFKDQYTFTLVDKRKKELFFAESRVYLGTDSPTTYTFVTVNPSNFQAETVVVNKKDVKSIVIN